MTDIAAVLLVPHEGDPHELLRMGPCWARPPMVERFLEVLHDGSEQWSTWVTCRRLSTVDEMVSVHDHRYQRALVLAWEGEAVRSGLLIYADAMDSPLDGHLGVQRWAQECLAGRGNCDPDEYGTYICIDSKGQEVSP